jgi:hypothetical protein
VEVVTVFNPAETIRSGKVEGDYYVPQLPVKSGRAAFTASSFRFN